MRLHARLSKLLILLLTSAGLGKTTIAHVVARHCGYRPFEINASDDRTASALQSRIQDAVQMQSVLGKRQMNLVIVDEVDGIAGIIILHGSVTCCHNMQKQLHIAALNCTSFVKAEPASLPKVQLPQHLRCI